MNLLCAANQISKSSTQIRKAIHWATCPDLWPTLWSHRPNQAWYLYPTSKQTRIEFETKWKLFLPTGKYKTEKELDFQDGRGLRPNPYRWKEEYVNKELFAIHFLTTGFHIYYKTYAQDTQSLQTGTVDAIFCDEELPEEHYGELIFRLSASEGYFHMVFTATLGQEFWRLAMEPAAHEKENFPDARKWCVSMFDCQKYMDGSPSHWTDRKIKEVISKCHTHNEVLKRVYGRFIMDIGGRKYPTFDIKQHMRPEHKLPAHWLIYEGVDIGSGGEHGHKAAIVFTAVSPDFRKGRAFLGWRGQHGVITTAGDVFEKHLIMKAGHSLNPILQCYDWGSKDFFTIAERAGEAFTHADKDHSKGEEILNTLFKNNMLLIYDTPELQKLATELSTLRRDTPKKKAKDDIADALRYSVTRIPWDWSQIGKDPEPLAEADHTPTASEQELADRRARFSEHAADEQRIEQEFADWNEAYGD